VPPRLAARHVQERVQPKRVSWDMSLSTNRNARQPPLLRLDRSELLVLRLDFLAFVRIKHMLQLKVLSKALPLAKGPSALQAFVLTHHLLCMEAPTGSATCCRRVARESTEGEQHRNALTAFLRRARGRKAPNIKQRKAAMERARVAEQEINSRIVELATKMMQPRHGAADGVVEHTLRSSMAQEVQAREDMRGVRRGTHRFPEERTGQVGIGAGGRDAFVKIDEVTGAMTYYPDRDNMQALRMRQLREHGRHDWEAEYEASAEARKAEWAELQEFFAPKGRHASRVHHCVCKQDMTQLLSQGA